MWPFKSKDSNSRTDRLSVVRKLDQQYEVFGADRHRYKLTPVAEDELADFEAWCGIVLPAAYRTHLLTSGYGAGPNYGLWSPSKIRKELETWYHFLERDNATPPHISDPFPLSQTDAQNCRKRQIAREDEPWITASWPLAGCLPIGHQGCEYYTVLQITGDAPGSVWDISEEGLWLPAGLAPGLLATKRIQSSMPVLDPPPMFDAWYQGWIDQIISDFSS